MWFFVKGEYKVILKGILHSDPSSMNYTIQFNYHLYKVSAITTMLRGNITTTITFNDSLDVSYIFHCNDSRYWHILNNLYSKYNLKIQNNNYYALP